MNRYVTIYQRVNPGCRLKNADIPCAAEDDVCPDCGSHHVVTLCPACNQVMCEVGTCELWEFFVGPSGRLLAPRTSFRRDYYDQETVPLKRPGPFPHCSNPARSTKTGGFYLFRRGPGAASILRRCILVLRVLSSLRDRAT